MEQEKSMDMLAKAQREHDAEKRDSKERAKERGKLTREQSSAIVLFLKTIKLKK